MEVQRPASVFSDAAPAASDPELLAEVRALAGRRSVVAAYLLWFFLGGLCAHCFYLGRWKQGLFRLVLPVFGFVLLCGAGVGFQAVSDPALADPDRVADAVVWSTWAGLFCLGWTGLWYVWDLFAIPSMVRRHQEELRQKARRELGLS